MKSHSAIKYLKPQTKIKKLKKIGNFTSITLNLANDDAKTEIKKIILENKPDTIVHLAHNPSAAFSMKNNKNANDVLINNIIGTNNVLWAIKETDPEIHLVNIGTTGEYDHYGNVIVQEGYFKFEDKESGRMSNEMIFPRRPGSIYHTSKVSMTYLVDFLCRAWNLRCTDIMQGIVVGTYTDEINETKIYSPLFIDEAFGTVLNRFIVEAKLNIPLTIYGEGEHQRPFLMLNDSVQALMIAIKNKPEKGKVRVWNQLSQWMSINEMANSIKNVLAENNLCNVEFEHIPTPRKEQTTQHFYEFKTDILKSLGYKPTRKIEQEILYTYNLLNLDYINDLKDSFIPKIIFTK